MNSSYGERIPDYLVVGHIAKDLTPEGPCPGGTVLYSGLTAQHLGMQAAVVTRCASRDRWLLDELEDSSVWVAAKGSPRTTTFTNRYDSEGKREQLLGGRAEMITLADVPPAWRGAPIVHLGPIAQELPADMPTQFTDCNLGITPQGWLRSWDAQGRVSHNAWSIPSSLARLPRRTIVVVSQEDLDFNVELIRDYARSVPCLVVTNGSAPASIFIAGMEVEVPAYPVQAIDPTGAGDVFAAALFAHYAETQNLETAVKFAHAAASLSITAPATTAIPSRASVHSLLSTPTNH